MSGYTKMGLIDKINENVSEIELFYKAEFINYRGKTVDTDELFTEVISKWIIEHIDLFDNIKTIRRYKSYYTSSHDGTTKNFSSNREEERIAMEIFKKGSLSIVGKILDYQVPLKNKLRDNAGKIDLLSYDGEVIRILELKKPDSDETMLRCVLEGYTYLKTVDKAKLINDFNEGLNLNISENTPIKACPFVFYNSKQHLEMRENRPCLYNLMNLLDISPLYIKDDYEITEE